MAGKVQNIIDFKSLAVKRSNSLTASLRKNLLYKIISILYFIRAYIVALIYWCSVVFMHGLH